MANVPGVAGYAEEAPMLLDTYEQRSFDRMHGRILHLLPTLPARVLDIGAGTGRDAAAFARRGYEVTAVEPVDALREGAMRLHREPNITWLDDGLPELGSLADRSGYFDVVMLTAVLMHLDAPSRARALGVIARLIRPGGLLVMYLRHGPVPEGRTMFDVTAYEIRPLAAALGLACILELLNEVDGRSRPGVSWTRLAFSRIVADPAEKAE